MNSEGITIDRPLLPAEVRPRERLLAKGSAHLGEVELLALVLGTAGPRPATRTAEVLLARHGSLAELARVSVQELAGDLGPARAARLAAALEVGRRAQEPRSRNLRLSTPSEVYHYARPRLAHLTREVFHVLLLDTRHRLVADRRVAEGGLASCAISPRDVFEAPIREAAPAMIFLHNHPSGDPTPSKDDVELTRRLAEASKLLGLSLLDHVVVADGGFSSLAEMGKL
ncbi:RadC family protein [Vulgatibacter incomptus]|nr:DNA repair protein RadC [Vulgatibacter incomptus]